MSRASHRDFLASKQSGAKHHRDISKRCAQVLALVILLRELMAKTLLQTENSR